MRTDSKSHPNSSVLRARVFEHLLGRSSDDAGRLRQSVETAEETGLVFAFRARCLAILVVAVSIVLVVPWARSPYYLAFMVGFFLSGYAPFRLRRHRHAELIKLAF